MTNDLLLTTVYRRAAISFFVLTIALLALVAYVVLPKALVVVTPLAQVFEETIPVRIGQGEDADIEGIPVSISMTVEQTFKTTGEKEVVESVKGSVTIHNTYSRSQTLVRTTRLLADNGALLRTDAAVTIAPGESKSVPVYLDPESQESSLPKGRLVIPGLWEGLREYIYGEITEPLSGASRSIRVLSADDIVFGQNTLREKAKTEAAVLLDSSFRARQDITESMRNDWKLDQLEISDEQWELPEQESGDALESFGLRGTITLSGMYYDTNAFKDFLEAQLLEKHGVESQIVTYEASMVESLDSDVAELRVDISGREQDISKTELLERYALSGLLPQRAITLLEADERIEQVSIELSPFWVTTIPRKIDLVILPEQ